MGLMLTVDVIRHFKTKAKTARAIGLTRGALSFWGKYVPRDSADLIEQVTGGKFTVDPELYAKLHAAKRAKAKKIKPRRAAANKSHARH